MKFTEAQLMRTLNRLCAIGAIERVRDVEGVERFSAVAEFALEDRTLPIIHRSRPHAES